MDKIELEVMPRTQMGKAVKKLRRENLTPVNVYGPGMDSIPLQADSRALARALSRAGRTTLLTLNSEGQKPLTVVVRAIQPDPRTNGYMHVDFYRPTLTEKMRLQVPLRFVGEPVPAIRSGTVVHSVSVVEVECLPSDMPHAIEVDVSAIKEFNTPLHVSDLPLPPNVTIITDQAQPVAVVEPPRVAEEVPAGAEAAPPVEEVASQETSGKASPAKEEGQ